MEAITWPLSASLPPDFMKLKKGIFLRALSVSTSVRKNLVNRSSYSKLFEDRDKQAGIKLQESDRSGNLS